MKKILPIVVLYLLALSASAQNLKITRDNTGIDVAGKKIVLTINDSSLFAENFTVTSIIKPGKSIKVKRTILLPLAGTSNSFCWAEQCYPEQVDVSPDATDFSQKTSEVFTADFNPMPDVKHTGTFAIRYVFFDESNTRDSTFFELQLDVMHNAGVKNNTNYIAMLSAVYPNPATVKAELKYRFTDYYTAAVAKVYNLLGSEVLSQTITTKEGIVSVPVSALEDGLYFISISVDNKPLATRKFVVHH